MRYLRNEELKLIREAAKAANGQSLMLSYDAVPCEYEDSVWLQDPLDLENCVLTKIAKNEFCKLLTDKQLSVFEKCMLGGKSHTEYAKEHQISVPAVFKCIRFIRDKANIFFGRVKK